VGLSDPEGSGHIIHSRNHWVAGVRIALESLDLLEDDRARLPLLVSLDAACLLGWDPAHGGLLRYTDTNGPYAPTGAVAGTAYEEQVRRTWSTKLCWAHCEASAATALAGHGYGHRSALDWFERICDYTLRTFPAGDDGGEWIQVRSRRGDPVDNGSLGKDPWHVPRTLMQLVELGDAHREPVAG